MKRAAGILFHAPGDRVLLMHRTGRAQQDADHAGDWAFPGGGLEGDETPEQAARREVLEETGHNYTAPIIPWTRRISEDVEFTTFLAEVPEEFEVTLNDEHDKAAWVNRRAALGDITEIDRIAPLHPGAKIALERFEMDELACAKAMRDGELASPMRYMNMLLCDMRITGTEYSYRSGRNEYVWRDPSIYMNEEFLERCNGLPVVVNHPPGNVLDSDEYKARIAGSVFVPYIRPETKEVWGIVKIHDMKVAEDLENKVLSTSPGVAFRTVQEAGARMAAPDGRILLIEGKPSLLDHLAICGLGVWDKGGPPAGVSNQLMETVMPEDNRKDGEDKLDKILDSVNSMKDEFKKECDSIRSDMQKDRNRMDSMEKELEKERADAKARMDAEEKERADKARKDAEEKEKEEKERADKARMDAEAKEREEKERADKARADAANSDFAKLKAEFDTLKALVPPQVTPETRAKLVAHQVKAERVYQAFGDTAPPFVANESEAAYAVRLLTPHLKHSKQWKDVKLDGIQDVAALGVIEDAVYADAYAEATQPTNFKPGVLIPQRSRDGANREITRYVGDPNACWDQFNPPIQYVKNILTPGSKRLQ